MGRSGLRGLLVVIMAHVLAESAESHVIGDQYCHDDYYDHELPIVSKCLPCVILESDLLSTSTKVLW